MTTVLKELQDKAAIFRREFLGRKARNMVTGATGVIIGGTLETRAVDVFVNPFYIKTYILGTFELKTEQGIDYLRIEQLEFIEEPPKPKRICGPND